jgi:3-hydroxypropanoate dehydrogenase
MSVSTLEAVLADELVLSGEDLALLFTDARTANSFTDEPVTDEQLRAIHELVQLGPTALNSLPLRVLAVRSPEAKQRLLPLMSEGNRAKTAAAPLTLVLGYDVDFHDKLSTTFPHFAGARDLFLDDAARHATARDNAHLQAGYLVIAIRAAGLFAGPMGGFDKEGVDAEFFADGRTKSILTVNVGHPGPDAWFDRLPRLAFDEVVTSI